MPWGGFLALAAVAALEVGARSPAASSCLKRNQEKLRVRGIGQMFQDRRSSPLILIMGSSRTSKISTPMLDKALGLPEGSTLNISCPGATCEELIETYRTHRSQLAAVRLLLFNIDEYFFQSPRDPGPRLLGRNPLVGAQPILGLGLAFPDFLRVMSQGLAREYVLDRDPGPPVAPFDPRAAGSRSWPTSKEAWESLIRRHHENKWVNPVKARSLEALGRDLEAEGCQLVLMELPNHSMHRATLQRLFRENLLDHERLLRDLAGRLRVPLQVWNHPEEAGLVDASFFDQNHLNLEGAIAFTRHLGTLIRRQEWFPRSPPAGRPRVK